MSSKYREQHGCHDCAFRFRYVEYDDDTTYYCTCGAPKRPLCGSMALNESFFYAHHGRRRRLPDTDAAHHARYEAWSKWREGRERQAWGICTHWSERALGKAKGGRR